jgi:hypothetical protein
MGQHHLVSFDGLLRYSGRYRGDGLSDLIPGPDVVSAVERAEGVLITDPLSFPWEHFDADGPRVPMILDTSACLPDDLMALRPVLVRLTNSDAFLGDPETVELVSADLGLPSLWLSNDEDFLEHVRSVGSAKLADIEERLILRRLSADEGLVVIIIPGADIRGSRTGFADTVRRLCDVHEGATVDTIWGIHPQPGRPVERAVVALRSGQSLV